MNQQTKRLVLAVTALAFFAGAFAAVWLLTRDTPVEGGKTVSLNIVIDGKTTWSETVRTDALYLRQVLEEAGIVTAGEGAYLKTVNGRTADGGKQEWWSLSKAGEMLLVGAGEAVVEDGDSFTIELMAGWDEW